MTNAEIVLSVSIGCLAVAMTLLIVKVNRHERYFHSIQDILSMIGMKMAMDIREQEKEKVNG